MVGSERARISRLVEKAAVLTRSRRTQRALSSARKMDDMFDETPPPAAEGGGDDPFGMGGGGGGEEALPTFGDSGGG